MTDLAMLCIVGVVALVGGYVQGCIGFGVGTIAAPIIALMDPTLMPFAVLILGGVFSITTVLHDWKSIRWRESVLALVGRVPGTIAAVLVVALLPIEVLELVIAVAVLAAVALSASGSLSFTRTRRSLLLTGAASGFGGTAAGIGGPPLVLVYQDANPAHRRATMAAVFALGTLLSILTLVLGGEFDFRAAMFGVVALPFLAIGFSIAAATRDKISQYWLRVGVLGTAAFAGTVLLIQVVL